MSVGKLTKWTDEMIDFLKVNFKNKTNKELADHLGLTLTVTRNKLYELGLKRIEMEYWTDEQIQFLRDHYRIWGDVELAEYFEKHFPKNKEWTKHHIEKKRKYLGLVRTPKELKEIRRRNIKNGRYSKYHYKRWVGRVTEIGTIKLWNSGDKKFLVIKVDPTKYPNHQHLIMSKTYLKFSHFVWFSSGRDIPEGKVLMHKDFNPLNCSLDNLECGNRKRLGERLLDSDRFIAGRIVNGDRELRELLIKYQPELIELKRNQLKLRRKIKYATEGKTRKTA